MKLNEIFRYRAPELLLKQHFDTKIDVWALGCVVSEMKYLKPLYPGCNVRFLILNLNFT